MLLILPSGDKISWRSAGVLVAEAEEIENELRLLKHKARNGIAVAEAVAEEHGHCQ